VDQVLCADRGEQPRLAAERVDGLLQGIVTVVQGGEHRPAADLQTPLVELVAQPLRILREESLRAELGPDVAGLGQLVEVLPPRHLVRVLREPHAPRVRGGAQAQPGQVR
jgi:hypothetical protein